VVIDTQSDIAHARQMIEMFSKVWSAMPKRVINTHEDGDHVAIRKVAKAKGIDIKYRSSSETISETIGGTSP
jgi:cyclase